MVQYLWLLLGGAQEMRAACLLVALLVLLGVVSSLWADPFSEVPAGHWAYEEWDHLASLGMLPGQQTTSLPDHPQITRFEFGIAVLEPLSSIDDAVASLGPDPDSKALLSATARALRLTPRSSEEEIAQAAAGLLHLSDEFGDELQALNFDPARAARGLQALTDPDAVRGWRTEALVPTARMMALTDSGAPADALRVPLARGTVALSLPRNPKLPELLDYLAQSAAAEAASGPGGYGLAEPALKDPQISRLRTAYEYGVGSALTLSLAYEEIARRGQGMAALDTASLASFGIGYQLTPSTSVKLSYSLLEYSNYVLDTPPLRDRVAETAVSIGF